MTNNLKLALLNAGELETAIEHALNKHNSIVSPVNAEMTAKQDETIKYFSIKEACKILGCCRASIFNWSRQGLISYRKVGRKVLFSKENLENCGSSVSFENNKLNLTINGVGNERKI